MYSRCLKNDQSEGDMKIHCLQRRPQVITARTDIITKTTAKMSPKPFSLALRRDTKHRGYSNFGLPPNNSEIR